MITLIEKYICKREKVYPYELHELNGKGKLIQERHRTDTRQMIMYYAVKNKYSLQRAGEYFGQDHSTASHALNNVRDLCEGNKDFRDKIRDYDKKLLGLYKYSESTIVSVLELDIPARIETLKKLLFGADSEIDILQNKVADLQRLSEEIKDKIKYWRAVI